MLLVFYEIFLAFYEAILVFYKVFLVFRETFLVSHERFFLELIFSMRLNDRKSIQSVTSAGSICILR